MLKTHCKLLIFKNTIFRILHAYCNNVGGVGGVGVENVVWYIFVSGEKKFFLESGKNKKNVF